MVFHAYKYTYTEDVASRGALIVDTAGCRISVVTLPSTEQARSPWLDMSACQDGQAAMAIRLLKILTASSSLESDNLIFSPLSIHAAMALAAAGARGRTLDEFLAVLGAPSMDALAEYVGATAGHTLADRSGSGGPAVAFACGAWSDASRPLSPAYRDAVVKTYKATTASLDFKNNAKEACDEINAWVAKVTRNLIISIVDPDDEIESTVVLLANAIYFKGKWAQTFDKEETKDRKFHLLDGSTVVVPFMQSSEDKLIACHDGFKVLKLPYKMKEDDDTEPPCKKRKSASSSAMETELPKFSMCIFLPDACDGLRSLMERITSDKGFLFDHLPKRHVPVGKFRLPRFKLSFLCSVGSALAKLGLHLAFIPGEADLSGMVEDSATGKPMYVRGVYHKAVVEVNEEGTEAAAVTWLHQESLRVLVEEKPKVDFVADHPFAFFIVEERSSAVLFAGQVTNPSLQK